VTTEPHPLGGPSASGAEDAAAPGARSVSSVGLDGLTTRTGSYVWLTARAAVTAAASSASTVLYRQPAEPA